VRGSTIVLDDPDELHHLRDVLRLRVGDGVVCCDGTGAEYVGTIAALSASRAQVRVERLIERPSPPVGLWLAQGLPKAERFEWVVQKATELGADRLSPLLTRHTIVRLTPEQARAKLVRWQRIAQEAAKQSQRATIPQLEPPQSLPVFLEHLARGTLVLMPTLVPASASAPWPGLADALKTSAGVREVVILIGPEGDFSREEVALAQRHGARPVSLGPLTLRTDTAAIATLAIVSHLLRR